jgi:hypothetical protein
MPSLFVAVNAGTKSRTTRDALTRIRRTPLCWTQLDGAVADAAPAGPGRSWCWVPVCHGSCHETVSKRVGLVGQRGRIPKFCSVKLPTVASDVDAPMFVS